MSGKARRSHHLGPMREPVVRPLELYPRRRILSSRLRAEFNGILTVNSFDTASAQVWRDLYKAENVEPRMRRFRRAILKAQLGISWMEQQRNGELEESDLHEELAIYSRVVNRQILRDH